MNGTHTPTAAPADEANAPAPDATISRTAFNWTLRRTGREVAALGQFLEHAANFPATAALAQWALAQGNPEELDTLLGQALSWAKAVRTAKAKAKRKVKPKVKAKAHRKLRR